MDPANQISKNKSNAIERYDILKECDISCTRGVPMMLHLSSTWVSKRTVSSMCGIAYAVPAMQNAESHWPALVNGGIPGIAQEPGQHVAFWTRICSDGVVTWADDTPIQNSCSWVLVLSGNKSYRCRIDAYQYFDDSAWSPDHKMPCASYVIFPSSFEVKSWRIFNCTP